MTNIEKCFYILNNLNYTNPITEGTSVISLNITFIKKHLNTEDGEVIRLSVSEESPGTNNANDEDWLYSCLLFHILYKIKTEICIDQNNLDNAQISEENIEIFMKTLMEASKYGIRKHLITEMYKHPILDTSNLTSTGYNYERLQIAMQYIDKIYLPSVFESAKTENSITLDSMSGAICLLSADTVGNSNKIMAERILNYFSTHTSKIKYFKNLLMLKSIKDLPTIVQTTIHKNLLDKLQEDKGFVILLKVMLPENELNDPNWQLFEIISNIVSHKGHTINFHITMISQIFNFIDEYVRLKVFEAVIPAGVLSLRKLYKLKPALKISICNEINKLFEHLIKPECELTGTIVMEHHEIYRFINILSFIFCGTSMQSLPSEILIKYLPLLISLHAMMPEMVPFKEQLKTIIVYCLANREKLELRLLLQNLIFHKTYEALYPRITISFNQELKLVAACICRTDLVKKIEILNALTSILTSSNNNILLYNSFMAVLHILENENISTSQSNIDLLCDVNDLEEFLVQKYNIRFSILMCLKDMIAFKPFHSQFQENPTEFIEFIKISLEKRNYSNFIAEDDNSLPLILEIFQEIIDSSSIEFKKFINLNKIFSKRSNNVQINRQIENLIKTIENKNEANENFDCMDKNEYRIAKNLIEESQSHLKVYGMNLMTKLIDRNDDTAIANKYSILAIALHTLRDEESFTFLYCIKLFKTLTNIMQAEVFEILTEEYLNEKEEVDFRLKVGEAILKVTEDLGECAYKYKAILINCFINGSKNGPEEFRCSSLSNLATVCRLMTYQVHHFFYELFQLVIMIINTEKYLPLKRAAVFVITQLLSGVDNLIQFQEYLLPIYRILKFIMENEQDREMLTHAANGLKSLNEKCIEFLQPEMKFEPKIQFPNPVRIVQIDK